MSLRSYLPTPRDGKEKESQELVTEWFPTDYIHRHCPSSANSCSQIEQKMKPPERHQISTFF